METCHIYAFWFCVNYKLHTIYLKEKTNSHHTNKLKLKI